MLNSIASGRRLALRLLLWQVVAAVLIGLVFLALGRREAVAAAAGALMAALGNALLSLRFFGGLSGAGMVIGRLFTGMILKWVVILGGLFAILVQYKLPPLAAITGLVAASAVNLMAFRFKG